MELYIKQANGRYRVAEASDVYDAARHIAAQEHIRLGSVASPEEISLYFKSHFLGAKAEKFSVVWLDTRHRVIAVEDLFFGTINGASVYPREVVRRALEVNAGAVVLGHNHPSGVPEPSSADRQITTRLTEALALVDVRILDHIIVGGDDYVSFAQRGWL